MAPSCYFAAPKCHAAKPFNSSLGQCDPSGSSPCSLNLSLNSQSLPADEPTGNPDCRSPMPSFQDPQIYRDILDGLQIGVSALDPQKKTVFWSDGAEK